MYNNFMNQPMYNGFGYATQPQAPLQYTNPLTKEEEEFLKKNSPDFTLEATREELARAICTHRDPQKGTFTISPNDDGTVTCTKCGARFNPVQRPKEEIEELVNGVVDILQSAKMMYVDMNNDSVRSYFQMIPFLEKAPKLYEVGIDTFKKIAPNGAIQQNSFYGNPFATLSNAMGTPGFGMPVYGSMPQQPMQPQYYQNGFVGQPQYGTAVDPNNPFQQTQNFGQTVNANQQTPMNVQQPPQQVQQVNNAQPQQQTQAQNVEVHGQFEI